MANRTFEPPMNELAKRLSVNIRQPAKAQRVTKPSHPQSSAKQNPLFKALNLDSQKRPARSTPPPPPAARSASRAHRLEKPAKKPAPITRTSIRPVKAPAQAAPRVSPVPKITTPKNKESDELSFLSGPSNEFNFKHASRPKFLRINNLQYGTSISDIDVVVSRVAPIKKILTRDSPRHRTVMCEIFFKDLSSDGLVSVFKKFQGKRADGNVLKCEIDDVSKVLLEEQYEEFLTQLKDKKSSSIHFVPRRN